MTESRSAADLPTREDSRHAWWSVALLTALAAALRFLCLGTWGLWADEVATLRDAVTYGRQMDYFLGYAMIGLVTNHLGDSEWWARLVPAVAGIVTVPVIYLVGRDLFSHRTGVFAALFLALSNSHLFFSQYSRYYTLLVLATLLGMWWAQRGIERNRRGWLLAAVAVLALGGLVHWTAGLCVAALALCLAWLRLGRERPKGLSLSNVLILTLPFLLGAAVLSRNILKLFSEWAAPDGLSFLRAGLAFVKILDRLDVAVVIFAAVGAAILFGRGDRRSKWLLGFAVVPVLLTVAFIGMAQGGSRFAIVALAPVTLLGAFFLDHALTSANARRRKVAWVLLSLALLAISAKDAAYYTIEHGQRPRWKEAVDYLIEKGAPGRTVVGTNASGVVGYYLSRTTGAGRIEVAALDDVSAGRRDVDLLVVENVANVRPSLQAMEKIAESYAVLKVFENRVRFLDYSITVYVRRNPRE